MGEAKRRKAEIEELKRKSPEEAVLWRQQQKDTLLVRPGITPDSHDPEPVAALARLLKGAFIEAKTTGNIDPAVTLYYATITATIRGLSDVPIACKKGCSHCCYTWVSVSIPEALYIAKIIKLRGSAAIEKVRLANERTKDYDFEAREEHPEACPLLEDHLCSIYDERPKACRLAASGDAEICERSFHHITNEDIPTPLVYGLSRASHSVALAAGLRKANLSYHAHEFNAALTRALDTEDAERRWLSGEDIFHDVRRDPEDLFSNPQAQKMYEYAFK